MNKMELSKKELITVVEALEFLLDHMTDDGDEEKAIDRGFYEEVKLIRKMRNNGI